MAKLKTSFANLFNSSEQPVEIQLLSDIDYVVRQMNKNLPHYSMIKISLDDERIDKSKRIDIMCVDKLPEPSSDNEGHIYHINNDGYYMCVFKDGKPTRTYKPSSMKCLRQMYYQLIGADTDEELNRTSDFYGICESGEDRHKRIQTYFMNAKKYGIDLDFINVSDYVSSKGLDHLNVISESEYETKIHDNKRNITFMCDGIIKYKEKYYIIEIKTESSYKFSNREYVDASHRIQAYTYSLEFGIDEVIFIYENRDVCTKKPYRLVVTDADRKFIEDRIETCDSFLSKKETPPIDDSVNKYVCQYCDYKTKCKLERIKDEESKQG